MRTITVTKAILTATADDTNKTFGVSNPVFGITYSGFVDGEDQSVLDTTPMVSTDANETSDVDTYTLTASGGSDNHYDFQYVSGTLTITPVQAAVTLSDLEQEVDGSLKVPTITTDPEGLNTTITYDGVGEAPISSGNYQVVATIDERNYEGSTSGTFVLTEVLLSAGIDASSIRIYPNPTSGQLTIKGLEISKVVLFDINGKKALTSNQKEIDLTTLKEGVYLLSLYNKFGEMIYQQRLIKN